MFKTFLQFIGLGSTPTTYSPTAADKIAEATARVNFALSIFVDAAEDVKAAADHLDEVMAEQTAVVNEAQAVIATAKSGAEQYRQLHAKLQEFTGNK